ncbi:MAG: hypothetical protein M1514_01225, partial [Patescibacteria group bacterium]|nr:hypothetical protein [Patescibacteria group bacterium]
MIILQIIIVISLLLLSPMTANASVSNWQKGVTIEPNSPTALGSEDLKQSLSNLSNTHANFVTFIIPYYQSSTSSVDLAPGWNTPTDDALIAGIKTAHSQGLKVMLKIHPELMNGDWRGYIDPTDRAAWFQKYGEILNHYAVLGRENQVDAICLGAEMFKLTTPQANSQNTGFWRDLIDQVRSQYSGLLTYSAQHTYPNEADEIEFWDKLDFIGFAAYFALSAEETNPSLESLKASWEAINQSRIAPLYQKWGKPIIFTEIGYRSLVNSHADPWDWGRQGAVDEAEQARDYEALFSYWDSQSFMQ